MGQDSMGKTLNGVIYFASVDIGDVRDNTLHFIEKVNSVDYIVVENYDYFNLRVEQMGLLPTGSILSYEMSKDGNANVKEINNIVIEHVKNGKHVLVVSDEGSSVIADPGEALIDLCRDNQINYYFLPGASAIIQSLTCGLSKSEYHFAFFGTLSFDESNNDHFYKTLSKIKSIYDSEMDLPAVVFLNTKTVLHTMAKIIEYLDRGSRASLCCNLTQDNQVVYTGNLAQIFTQVKKDMDKNNNIVMTLVLSKKESDLDGKQLSY
jgi:16S rRNA (cytidine1402-2'-O)-methyltransferase